jgi:hypothetical protein
MREFQHTFLGLVLHSERLIQKWRARLLDVASEHMRHRLVVGEFHQALEYWP